MNHIEHISDNDLLLVVNEQPTELPQTEIESHVANCATCQTRLLELAADATWRQEFSSSLKELPSLKSHADQSTGFAIDSNRENSGDEFDLKTVDSMLDEVLAPPVHPEMLGKLDRYDIEGVIGCGGMGVVLRGFDRDLHRPVAIKMILPRLANHGTAKQRFAREARAAAAVLHPNVIAIHGIDETNGVPWFVMPLVAGPSLKALVEQQGPLPEREIVRIGLQIASGLAAAHSQGLVHRDIKPENVLVDNQINRVVITDFGLARRESDEAMTQTGWLAGTLNYMSPEQTRGDDIDSRSDLFSLGGLLYFLAAGVVPFRGESAMKVLHKIGNENPSDVRTHNNEISESLSAIIDRLLEKLPEQRIQSAVELETILNDYLAHLHQPAKVPAPVIPVNKKSQHKNSGVRSFVALAAVALCGSLAWWGTSFWWGTSEPPNEAPLTWHEVAKKHELELQPGAFDQQIVELGRSVELLRQSLDRNQMSTDSNAIEQEMNELNRSLNKFTDIWDWSDPRTVR